MTVQGNLGVERMCLLAQVSRASFYRSLKERGPAEEEVEARSALQQVVLEHRRRYAAALRRRGMIVNRKGVSLRLAIPQRVALQHCPLPLRQPSVSLREGRPFEKNKSFNGECSFGKLSQGRGPTHLAEDDFIAVDKPRSNRVLCC